MTVRRFFATLRMTILGAQSLYSVNELVNTYRDDIKEGPAPNCTEHLGNGTVLPFRRNDNDCITGWSHRLAWPRTAPSQGADTGSNPVGTTISTPGISNSFP